MHRPTDAVIFGESSTGVPMPQFVIERELPGPGKLSPAELKAISQKSCGVLSQMGPAIQWVHSYVTPDKIYCVYRSPRRVSERRVSFRSASSQATWWALEADAAEGMTRGRYAAVCSHRPFERTTTSVALPFWVCRWPPLSVTTA